MRRRRQMLNSSQEELAMKRLIASVVLAIALLTSGAVVTQSRLVGTAYASDDAGD
jgi:hypothetical protein